VVASAVLRGGMKKTVREREKVVLRRKLALNRETIAALKDQDLAKVGGGFMRCSGEAGCSQTAGSCC
jgi:hypothetical protein